MKHLLPLMILMTGAAVLGPARAQVTNLVVNGQASNFSMTSGDNITWSYDIPTGTTTAVEIWYDVNGNGTIESGTDKLFFNFTQTDGDTTGHGPPDLDGAVNGHIYFTQPVGIAPGKYIMKFTNNGSATISGTMLALSSPAYTISGHVTPPLGKSSQYIVVEAHRSDHYQPNFWDGITNASGDYSIQMNSDTAGNPWSIRLSTQFPPNLSIPADTQIVIDGNKAGINFSFEAAVAQVTGYLLDENDSPIGDEDVQLMSNSDYSNHQGRTDISGFFQIGLTNGELQGQTWTLSSNMNGYFTTTTLQTQINLPVIVSNDSLFRILKVYSTNSQIRGKIEFDGQVPSNPLYISARSDSGISYSQTDSLTGNFTFQVSNKIYTYQVSISNLPPNTTYPNQQLHPGDSDIVINMTPTGVAARGGAIPTEFRLEQNYPNPFNPTTDIVYDIPKTSVVRLSVFNMLGQEIIRLVDGQLGPGRYRAVFDGSKAASGVYICRLGAGGFVSNAKMLLLK